MDAKGKITPLNRSVDSFTPVSRWKIPRVDICYHVFGWKKFLGCVSVVFNKPTGSMYGIFTHMHGWFLW